MDARIVFRVLGPLQVVADERMVPVAAGKVRTILAALLLRANQTVPVIDLIEYLWEGRGEPGNARSTVQKYVMRARHFLVSTGAGDGVIVTDGDGYRMVLPPGQLDLDRFRDLQAEAAEAARAGDAERERLLLGEALVLWRAAPPLADVPAAASWRDVLELEERRLRMLDRRIELDLARGQHGELIPELAALVRRHPHQERFWAYLMRALHRAGRQGDALAAYREVARRLAEELGIDPGPELQAAHREVLGGGEELVAGHTGTRAPDSTPPAPVRQLPRTPVEFVGRRRELADVLEALDQAPVVISGMPGVGKTALAVTAAHRAAPRYPDGQLFVDLGGYAVQGPPDLSAVLARMLGALGVGADELPDGVDEQAMVYRSLLADRRMLVVVDNVADSSTARLLLPGSPRCAVLFTSRDELPGLAVSPGAHQRRVEELDQPSARRMLAALVSTDRTDAEPAAVEELVAACGGLALAVRIAAAQLTSHPRLAVADHVARIRADDPVLALRVPGDRQADLLAAFTGSYRRLGEQGRRMLRALGRSDDPEVSVEEAAVLVELPPGRAAAALEELATQSLLTRLPAGRYRSRPLVHGFARSRTALERAESAVRPPPREVTPIGRATGRAAG